MCLKNAVSELSVNQAGEKEKERKKKKEMKQPKFFSPDTQFGLESGYELSL